MFTNGFGHRCVFTTTSLVTIGTSLLVTGSLHYAILTPDRTIPDLCPVGFQLSTADLSLLYTPIV